MRHGPMQMHRRTHQAISHQWTVLRTPKVAHGRTPIKAVVCTRTPGSEGSLLRLLSAADANRTQQSAARARACCG